MNQIKNILLTNQWFLYPYVSLLSFSTMILLVLKKNDIQYAINKLNTPLFDSVFKYATTLAEGISIGSVILLTLFIRIRWTFVVVIALLYNTLIIFALKNFVFKEVARPKVFFSQIPSWHTIEGVKLHTNMSFPSGHTAAAFCMFFALAITLRNKKLGFILFILSFMVGYSRMYLSQHYLRDVVVGSVIGITMAILAYLTTQNTRQINQISWLDKSLPQLLSKS